MTAAARLGDPIEHSSALNGLLTGLAIGAGTVLIGVAVVGTGGLGGVALAAMVGAAATTGAGIGHLLGSLSFAQRQTGKVNTGSKNVYINGLPAARAQVDYAKCSDHSNLHRALAQGSSSVYINGLPAARVGDRTVCDAKISAGSPNVIIGGVVVSTNQINPEVPTWLEITVAGIGLASAVVLVGPIMAFWGVFGGIAGAVAGDRLGGLHYGGGSDGQKLFTFAGSVFFGGLAARYKLQPDATLGANLGNLRISKRPLSSLIQTGKPSKNIATYKVPYASLTKGQRANYKQKMESRSLTRDQYKRLEWDRRFANKRAKGVARFWADERAKLRLGESGTRAWSGEQRSAILRNKVPTFNGEPIQGHHRYNAISHPHLASDPENIYPATRTEHLLRWHGGSWKNDSFGAPLNLKYPEEF